MKIEQFSIFFSTIVCILNILKAEIQLEENLLCDSNFVQVCVEYCENIFPGEMNISYKQICQQSCNTQEDQLFYCNQEQSTRQWNCVQNCNDLEGDDHRACEIGCEFWECSKSQMEKYLSFCGDLSTDTGYSCASGYANIQKTTGLIIDPYYFCRIQPLNRFNSCISRCLSLDFTPAHEQGLILCQNSCKDWEINMSQQPIEELKEVVCTDLYDQECMLYVQEVCSPEFIAQCQSGCHANQPPDQKVVCSYPPNNRLQECWKFCHSTQFFIDTNYFNACRLGCQYWDCGLEDVKICVNQCKSKYGEDITQGKAFDCTYGCMAIKEDLQENTITRRFVEFCYYQPHRRQQQCQSNCGQQLGGESERVKVCQKQCEFWKFQSEYLLHFSSIILILILKIAITI